MDAQLASALEGLRDIHLPPPVSFWPPAPGWWALGAAILLLAAATALAIRWHRRRTRSVRARALRELAALEARFAASSDLEALAIDLTALLRRVALARAASERAEAMGVRRDVAALHGEPWIAYLTQGRFDAACSPQIARELVHSAYAGARAARAADPRAWLDFTRAWIREVA